MVTTNIQSFSGNVEVAGTLSVTGNLISTTGVDKVDLSTDTTNALRPVIFSTGTTGSQSLKTDPGITYNPSTKTFTLTDNITASNATVSDYLIHKDNTNTYLGFPADDTISFTTGGGEKVRITSTGNLGVGSAAPAYKLHVVGNTYVTSNLTVGTANLHVDTLTGNVGIGTNSPAYKLDVRGTASHAGSELMARWNSQNETVFPQDITAQYHKIATLGTTGDGSNGGKLRISGTIGGFGESSTTLIDAFVSTRGGPSYGGTLHGYGGGDDPIDKVDILVYKEADDTFAVWIKLVRFFTFDFTVTGGTITGASRTLVLLPCPVTDTSVATPTGTLEGSVVSACSIVFTAGGNLGIGTTNPTSNLHVVGDAYVNSNLTVGTANLHVDTTTGFVGVGTNNPVGVNGGNRLEGSSATGFEFISSRADNTTDIDDFIGAYLFKNTDTDGNAPHYCGMSAKGATTNGAMSLYFHSQRDKYELGNTPDLFIDTNGRVGVGTDDPDYTLDVVGTGGFSSNLTVGTANLHVDTTTGNVGIGVANPTKSLEINGTTLRHAYEYRYQDAWISNNNQTFTIPVTGGSARGEMLVEAEVIQVAANSSSERMARVKGIITNHHTGNFYMKVLEGENATAFETYIVGTSGSASGTFTMKYQPQQGYQQLVRCRLNLKIFIGGFTSSLGSLTRTDAGSNSDLTAPTLNSAPKIIGGNVGIGTSEPAYTLDVTGPINLTSNIVMSGEVFIKAHDATSNHVAIGPGAGQTSQGTNAVAVGYLAGQTNQHDNTVVLNASGSALNTVGTGRTYIKPLRVATVASNVMTYDQATGEVMDSGGLISNKLAIVSEQPPVALTGDSTVVDGHGRYKVTASLEAGSYQAWKCFNKSIDNADSGWSTGAVGAYNSDGTYAGSNVIAGVSGEWVKIEFPYKTTLRHVSLSPNVYYSAMPENFSIVASNDDSNWTVIKSVTGQAWTSADYVNFVINAGVAYKYYAIVAQLTNTNYAYIGEWKLFTETFTVDAGVVSTTAASGLDVGFTEHPVEPMTDYHTYVEGHGTYEASASSYDSTYSLYPWETFDNNTSTRWTISTDDDNYNVSTGEWDQTAIDASPDVFTSDVGGTRYHGHWLQIKLPYTVTLSHTNIHPQTIERAPKDGVILGSNDGEAWYKLTEFSGKTYTASTWTRIDVNATTPYQYYRMCATKNGGDSKLELTEWRLFAEKPVTRMENVHISGDLSSETLQTGYIKWPRVPLKAAESEGYVASASSGTSFAYKAFNNTISNANDVWNSASVYTNGIANGTESFEGVDGSWIKIKLPQAIQLSHFNFYNQIGGYAQRAPRTGRVWASNDDVNWTQIGSFSQLSGWVDREPKRVDVYASATYSYYVFQAETIFAEVGNSAYVNFAVAEIELFEAATGVGAAPTSAKLQVAGSLGMAKGSEFFAGDDVVMELPKHDRPLVKYPEATGASVSSSSDTQSGNAFNLNY